MFVDHISELLLWAATWVSFFQIFCSVDFWNSKLESLNQRGFCKGVQTYDHIFTLNTCYIYKLQINVLFGVKSYQLNNQHITDLLWADNLVLLTLNKDSLQLMIDQLHFFCTDWVLLTSKKLWSSSSIPQGDSY